MTSQCPKCGNEMLPGVTHRCPFRIKTEFGTGKKCSCPEPIGFGPVRDPNCPVHGLTSEENIKRAARKSNEDQKAFMDKHAPDRTERTRKAKKMVAYTVVTLQPTVPVGAVGKHESEPVVAKVTLYEDGELDVERWREND